MRVVRASTPTRLPVVLMRDEVTAVISRLRDPVKLVVTLTSPRF